MAAPAWLCTSTRWPRWISSATEAGVRPTRFSWGLISLGTPISIGSLLDDPNATEQVDRHREEDGGILVRGDGTQRLHIAQLHGAGLLGQHLGGLHEFFRRLHFAFGVDHLGAPLAFGLGLAGDGADH